MHVSPFSAGSLSVQKQGFRRLAMSVLLLLLVPGMALAVTDDFAISEDAYVRQNRANRVNNNNRLNVRSGVSNKENNAYLKVTVSGVGTVTSALLRVNSVDVNQTIDVYEGASNSWAEGSLNWNNAPGSTGDSLDSLSVTSGWVEFDVTSAITGDGTYTFVFKGDADTNGRNFRSSEHSNFPTLIVTHDGGGGTAGDCVPTGSGPPLPVITFATSEIDICNGSAGDCRDVADQVRNLMHDWVCQRNADYVSRTTSDVVRMISATGPQIGQQEVADNIVDEWVGYERPTGFLAMDLTVFDAQITVDGNNAVIYYLVGMEAGFRWPYVQTGLFYEGYRKEAGVWKMTHQAESQVLNFTASTGAPLDFFFYDWSHPTNDVASAIDFYTPLLGDPEIVTATKATYNLNGPRFHLDTDDLGGFAAVRDKLPNGWATFIVDDLVSRKAELEANGVEFVSGIEPVGVDDRAVAVDVAGGGGVGKNIFVFLQKNYSTSGSFNPQSPTIQAEAGVSQAIIDLVRDYETAWLQADGAGVASFLDSNALYFDDTRSDKEHGAENTPAGVQNALARTWMRMDQSSNGLIAFMDITGLRAKTVGNEIIVSYERVIEGTGDHYFLEASMVTLEVDATSSEISGVYNVLLGSTTSSTVPGGALAAQPFDYTGYPVKAINSGEPFYTDIMGFGVPYPDTGYRGYWSHTAAVYGIFKCNPRQNQNLPRSYETNGYISFWVEDANVTYEYLQTIPGVQFHVIGAINSSRGVDNFEGYNQVMATDPEGNDVVYTDYPGD